MKQQSINSELSKEYGSALRFNKLYDEMGDSINSIEYQKQVKELSLKYEVDNFLQENETLTL